MHWKRKVLLNTNICLFMLIIKPKIHQKILNIYTQALEKIKAEMCLMLSVLMQISFLSKVPIQVRTKELGFYPDTKEDLLLKTVEALGNDTKIN